ncbi:hypothetical protein CCB80_13145 [Armatimonadetes bacterium Uphvl-Ar1]|nr:hypothetical protein CCB80_13145 [Armatimonadetes bacterium Uphvl-Ar1]
MEKRAKVVTPEEAHQEFLRMNAARTPNERVEALQALRNAFIPPDQRRLDKTCRYVKLPDTDEGSNS